MARYIDADKIDYIMASVYWGKDNKGRDEYRRTFVAFKSDVDEIPTADVVPRSEVGIECPCCHGTGGIGTSDWLIKNLTKKQLAEKKAQAIREADEELERKAKQEVASQVIDEFKNLAINYMKNKDLLLAVFKNAIAHAEAELKKKYIGEIENENN